MEENEALALYLWRKSFGALIVTFVLLRIIWRVKYGWPSHVSDYSNKEKCNRNLNITMHAGF